MVVDSTSGNITSSTFVNVNSYITFVVNVNSKINTFVVNDDKDDGNDDDDV